MAGGAIQVYLPSSHTQSEEGFQRKDRGYLNINFIRNYET